ALAKAAFPSATGVGLKALLLESVDPLSSLSSYTATGGRLNVNKAVTCNGAPKLWFESPSSGFDAEVGTPVTFTAIATRCADGSGVTVTATANGSPVPLTPRGDGLYSGTYTPSATGSMTLTLYDVPPDATGAITPGGSSVTVAAGTPGQNARLTFDAQAGQRVSLSLTGVTISSSYVSLLKPDGTALGASAYTSQF